ncbi:MAG: prepilin peptidase [bacterium]|nr:prepilin peptidase [bacterium]
MSNFNFDLTLYNYLLFWVCLIGLCLGSFYNVVILRTLSGESIIFPPSKCPKCNHKLYFWHNIPLLSYILLRGKCYFCKEKISLQYPIIEFFTMLLFAVSYVKFGITVKTLFVLVWVSCLIIMTATDIKEKIVECRIAILMGILGVLYGFISSGISGALNSLSGLIVGALLIEIIARLGYIFVKQRAMGEADTYVFGAIGSVVGLNGIFQTFIYSLFVSMIFVFPVFLYNRYKSGDKSSCIFSLLFFLSIIAYKLIGENYYLLGVVLLISVFLIRAVLMGLKRENSLNYLPFVPALTGGFLYYMFMVQ